MFIKILQKLLLFVCYDRQDEGTQRVACDSNGHQMGRIDFFIAHPVVGGSQGLLHEGPVVVPRLTIFEGNYVIKF